MVEVIVKDEDLQQAALEGMDEFLDVFVKAIYDAIGGELTAEHGQVECRPADIAGLEHSARRGDGWRICTADLQRLRSLHL